jgi:hypothetical protein
MCFTLVSVYVHTVDLVTLANILNSRPLLTLAPNLKSTSVVKSLHKTPAV